MKKLALIALAVFAVCALPAAGRGGPQDPATFTLGDGRIQQPVEQESPNFFFNNCNAFPSLPVCDPSTWVYNPTGCVSGITNPPKSCQGIVSGCAWDVDDSTTITARGKIEGTISGTLCVVADGADNFSGDNHLMYVRVDAPKDSLSVWLTNEFGVSVQALPVRNGSGYAYRACWIDVTPGPYPVIADSNGGTGIFVNYMLTISSSGRPMRDVFALLQSGYYGTYAIECP